MDTILVTGGAGFIGSNFVRTLVERGDTKVVNVDKLTYAGHAANLTSIDNDPNHVFVHADICDRNLIEQVVQQHQPVAVINFAAESHVDRSIDAPDPFLKTNVEGTFRLLQTAVEYFRSLAPRWQDRFRFLQISTDEVYGSLGETGLFSEKSQYQPNSPYAASKAAADHFVHAFWKTYGLPTLIANPSNNYGPFQFPEKLIPLMILNAIEGKSLPIYGDGNNIRDWVYVEDTCRAVEMILEKGQPGETYNIGGNFERSNRQVVEAICYLVDELCPDLPHRPCSSLIDFVEDRPGHDRRYAIDAGKIRDEIGWQPFVTFEKGLAQTVNWYVNQWDWIEQIAAGGSQRDRLGLTPKKNQHAPS